MDDLSYRPKPIGGPLLYTIYLSLCGFLLSEGMANATERTTQIWHPFNFPRRGPRPGYGRRAQSGSAIDRG